jgi:hypothetical protein
MWWLPRPRAAGRRQARTFTTDGPRTTTCAASRVAGRHLAGHDGGGPSCCRDGRFVNYSVRQGLFSDVIAILEDGGDPG